MEQPLSDNHAAWLRVAAETLETESAAVSRMRGALDEQFIRAVQCIAETRGKVICSGIGKSGHIAGKIAATLSSTGAPAFFMHASEAGHGDLGMIGDSDTVLLLSYSGESSELLDIIPALKRLQVPLIVIAGAPDSSLAQAADICLTAAVPREACPHNLAPTASTTAALALGDALAMAALTARGFSSDDFARTHPSGKLGRRLLLRVGDVMRAGEALPLVAPQAAFSDVLLEMTGKRMGMTLVGDAGALLGIITDGDLRRALDKYDDLTARSAQALMTAAPTSVAPDMLAADALQLMKQKRINHLAVLQDGALRGALSFHDLLNHKVM